MPTPWPTRRTTAIPPRFRFERERVLRILARWEESTRLALAPAGALPAPARTVRP